MARERELKQTDERQELVPPIDIFDTEEAVVVLADMPGLKPEHLDVNVDRGTLTIRGRRENAEGAGELRFQEFRVGDYVRSFSLGDDIDATTITAELKHGVLRLTLPKGPERRVRKIEVSGG
jgi:HSP20 family protein